MVSSIFHSYSDPWILPFSKLVIVHNDDITLHTRLLHSATIWSYFMTMQSHFEFENNGIIDNSLNNIYKDVLKEDIR